MRFAAWIFVLLNLCIATSGNRALAETKTIEWQQGERKNVSIDERGRLRLASDEKGYVAAGEFVSATTDLGKPGRVKLQWIEQWTTPQTWKKYDKNPIYGPKQSGAWDNWTNGVSIVRNPDNKTYKMFYAGRKGGGIGFAEGSIDDPLTWKENPASPVLKPAGNWEGNSINQPRVVKVTDEHWRMYYTGWGYKHPNGGTPWAFNLAESFDGGVTWKRHSEGPMLDRGEPGSPDDGGVFVPEVRRIGDRWMMWYTALKIAPGRQNIQLCLATSEDGVHWTKHEKNPVVTDDFSTGPNRNVISRCFVRHEGGVFRLWYSHAKPQYRIRYAESLDGAEWEFSPIVPVLDAGPKDAWDSAMVEYPEVDVVDGRWRLWFCGNGFGSVGFAEGVVETTLGVEFRTGSTPKSDDSWTAWSSATAGDVVEHKQYVQCRAKLSSQNPLLSPALHAPRWE